jgi:hypothetical protein
VSITGSRSTFGFHSFVLGGNKWGKAISSTEMTVGVRVPFVEIDFFARRDHH